MEFAASALFLLILLLPGFIIQATYTKGFWRWNSPTSNVSITEQIPVAVVLASILHTLWATMAAALFGQYINIKTTLMFLLGSYGHEEEYFAEALKSVTDHPYKIFFYFITLYAGAVGFGYLGHYLVREFKLDRRTRFLRFNNEWFYLLSGEMTEFYEYRTRLPRPDLVYLTVVVHHSDSDYLYRGIVDDFFFDKTGSLDRVVLRLAHRRALSDDRKAEQEFSEEEINKRYYNIEGDFFLLKYSEMSTLSVDFVFIEDEDEDEGEAEVAVPPAPTVM
jgi:hypothetical protein